MDWLISNTRFPDSPIPSFPHFLIPDPQFPILGCVEVEGDAIGAVDERFYTSGSGSGTVGGEAIGPEEEGDEVGGAHQQGVGAGTAPARGDNQLTSCV